MNLSGSQQHQYNQMRKDVEDALGSPDFSKHVYESMNGMSRIINAIVDTKGKNWAAQIVNDQGKPLLTPTEQQQFTDAFENYTDDILTFFGKEKDNADQTGAGLLDSIMGSKESDATDTKEEPTGVDDVYQSFLDRISNIDGVVNDYASKYGVLKLEKEYDLKPDIGLIPKPMALAISQGVTAVSAIPPDVTLDTLAKVKVPFRLIVFVIYTLLDVTRFSMAFMGRDTSRKVLSILLSVLELLRGDWKKSILTFMGYFGMTPLLYGQIGKIFLTAFRMFSPDLQENFMFGSFDAAKSFAIGVLLSVFQVTAPEEVRLPLIESLQKIARRKAEINRTLEAVDLPARPDYLSPSFQDLNNVQAVIHDKAYICSCEFEDFVKIVDKTSIIRTILQLLRIPVTEEFKKATCGNEPCKPFVKELVEEVKEESAVEEKKNNSTPGSSPVPKVVHRNVVEPGSSANAESNKPQPKVVHRNVVEPGSSANAESNKPQPKVVHRNANQQGGRKLYSQRNKIIFSREQGCLI